MRVVADTNTVVSGFLWKGPPTRLIDAAIAGRLQLLASVELTEELTEVLRRPKFDKNFADAGLNAEIILARYRLLVEIVQPSEIGESPLKDTDDNIVLACAVGGKADYIVFGDRHLLNLESYADIPILRVTAFLEKLAGGG